jgi:hypothetical protein
MKKRNRKLWLIEKSRVLEVQPQPGDTWEKLFCSGLQPGFYRSFPGEYVKLGRFTDDPRSFAGFPCPTCNCSVRTAPLITDPQIWVFGCSCTGVVIREPFDPFQQWHWRAFVTSAQVAQERHMRGKENITLAGIFYGDPHS